jgi:hypothetical protein
MIYVGLHCVQDEYYVGSLTNATDVKSVSVYKDIAMFRNDKTIDISKQLPTSFGINSLQFRTLRHGGAILGEGVCFGPYERVSQYSQQRLSASACNGNLSFKAP